MGLRSVDAKIGGVSATWKQGCWAMWQGSGGDGKTDSLQGVQEGLA